MTIFVTGSVFYWISHYEKVDKRWLSVVGFDNVNDYYDINLKLARIKELTKIAAKYKSKFEFIEGDLIDEQLIKSLFKQYSIKKVINLAAQVG